MNEDFSQDLYLHKVVGTIVGGEGEVFTRPTKPTSKKGTYVPPVDWLTIPTIDVEGGEQVFYGLTAVYDNDANHVRIYCTTAGNVDVTYDWGDGTVETVPSGWNNHTFNYDDCAGTDSTRGYRQSLVKITSTSTISIMYLAYPASDPPLLEGEYSLGWLDIQVNTPNMSTFMMYRDGNYCNFPLLERLEIHDNNISSFSTYPMDNLWRLERFYLKAAPNLTNTQYLLNANYSLYDIDIDVSAVTNMTVMTGTFANCYSIEETYEFNWSTPQASISLANMYQGCISLYYINDDLFDNYTSITSIQYMFNATVDLKYVPSTIDTSKAQNMLGVFQTSHVEYVGELDYSSCTNATQMFYLARRLKKIDGDTLTFPVCTSFVSMFFRVNSIQNIPKIVAPNATSFNTCFSECESIQEIEIEHNTLATFRDFAKQAYGLRKAIIHNWHFISDAYQMFRQTSGLTDIGTTDIDLSGLTNGYYMFGTSASRLRMPKIININPACTSIQYMFLNSYHDRPIEDIIDISGLNASCVTRNAFQGIVLVDVEPHHVNTIDFGAISNTSYSFTNMINGLNSNQRFNVTALSTTDAQNMFQSGRCEAVEVTLNPTVGSYTAYRFVYNNETIRSCIIHNAQGINNTGQMFYLTDSLEYIELNGMLISFDISDCKMSAKSINTLLLSLGGTVESPVTATATISNNFGTDEFLNSGNPTYDATLALVQSHGWTVVG